MKFAVLGSGAWGGALASCVASNNYDVFLWGRNKQVINRVNLEAKLRIQNQDYNLTKGLRAKLDLDLESIDILIVALPSDQIKKVFKTISWDIDKPVIVASKGFYNQDCDLISDGLKKDFGFRCIYALSGPNLAVEMLKDLPAAAVLAGPKSHLKTLKNI